MPVTITFELDEETGRRRSARTPRTKMATTKITRMITTVRTQLLPLRRGGGDPPYPGGPHAPGVGGGGVAGGSGPEGDTARGLPQNWQNAAWGGFEPPQWVQNTADMRHWEAYADT